MRLVILVSLAALALPVGLCGCQSCVDDSSGGRSSINNNPAPPRANGEPGGQLHVRPRLLPIPGRRMNPPPVEGDAEPPAAPSSSAPSGP
ncbi:MAG TPA: hypothetical protein VGG39_15500 [Polyangiaceae bacterium]|jgi:hypothetical protein